LVNGFEALLYLQQRGAVIINHPTIQANIGGHIRDKESVLVPIVNVANTTFLKPFTTAIIAVLIFVIIHFTPVLVHGSTNLGGLGIYTVTIIT